MTKFCAFILSIVSFCSSAFCQTELSANCDTIISKSTMRHTGFEPTLRDFIVNRIISDKEHVKHLTTQKQLGNEFTFWFCDDEKAVLIFEMSRDSHLQISLTKEKRKEDDIKTERQRPYSPFGKEESIDSQLVISSVTLSVGETIHRIPATAFDDLFAPNLCGVNLPMKPIQAFLSDDHEYVYVYICGKVKYEDESEFYNGFRKSYLAKLVVSLKDGYVTTIVVPGQILELYNWISCPIDFTGF